MKNFLGYIFTFLLGIVLIIPWVYKIIIHYRSGGEYVAGGLPGIIGLFSEVFGGIGLMCIGVALWSISDNLMKYKSIQITTHYTKIGLRIISVLVGVVFLIFGILLIKEEFEVSVAFIFLSVPLIVIGCKLSFKIMLYLFAILIVLFPFFNSSLPNLSVFNFVFAAVLVWFAKSTSPEQYKLVEKVRGGAETKKNKKKLEKKFKKETKKILNLLGRPICVPFNKLFPEKLDDYKRQLSWSEITLIPCYLWCFYFVWFSVYSEYSFDSFINSIIFILYGIFYLLCMFGLVAILVNSLFLFLNNLFSK